MATPWYAREDVRLAWIGLGASLTGAASAVLGLGSWALFQGGSAFETWLLLVNPIVLLMAVVYGGGAIVVGCAAALWLLRPTPLRYTVPTVSIATLVLTVLGSVLSPWIGVFVGFSGGVLAMVGCRAVCGERQARGPQRIPRREAVG